MRLRELLPDVVGTIAGTILFRRLPDHLRGFPSGWLSESLQPAAPYKNAAPIVEPLSFPRSACIVNENRPNSGFTPFRVQSTAQAENPLKRRSRPDMTMWSN